MVGDQELGSSMNDILHIYLGMTLKLCFFSCIVFLRIIVCFSFSFSRVWRKPKDFKMQNQSRIPKNMIKIYKYHKLDSQQCQAQTNFEWLLPFLSSRLGEVSWIEKSVWLRESEIIQVDTWPYVWISELGTPHWYPKVLGYSPFNI